MRALLSDEKVEVNFANAQGNTALHHVANLTSLFYTKILLDHPNINTDIRNGDSKSSSEWDDS
jgi:hypothetical protein